jgi:hypothetical protein
VPGDKGGEALLRFGRYGVVASADTFSVGVAVAEGGSCGIAGLSSPPVGEGTESGDRSFSAELREEDVGLVAGVRVAEHGVELAVLEEPGSYREGPIPVRYGSWP